MKKLALLALVISMNACANDLKIISTTVEHVDSIPTSHVQTKSAMCTASANAASGKAGQNITVSGYVSYVITNNTSSTQSYSIDEYMCVNGYGCTHIRNNATLAAHLTANGGGAIYNTEVLPKGSFVDQASIQVSGESTCFVQGSNSVVMS